MPDTPVYCAVVTRYEQRSVFDSLTTPVEWCLHPEEDPVHNLAAAQRVANDAGVDVLTIYLHDFGGPNGDQLAMRCRNGTHDLNFKKGMPCVLCGVIGFVKAPCCGHDESYHMDRVTLHRTAVVCIGCPEEPHDYDPGGRPLTEGVRT